MYRQGGKTSGKGSRGPKQGTLLELISWRKNDVREAEAVLAQARLTESAWQIKVAVRDLRDSKKRLAELQMQAILEPACTSCGNGLDSTVDCARCSGAEEGRN